METLQNISQSNINSFESLINSCFDVQKIQLTTDFSDFDNPSAYGIYKSSGGSCLGVVGKNYVPVQPKIMANSLLDINIDYSKVKFVTMKKDSKFRFDIPLTEKISFTNKFGKEDTTDLKICLQSGFDGKTKTSLFVYSNRLICENGAKANFTEYEINFKNVQGNQGKLISLAHGFYKVKESVKSLEQFYLSMDKVTFDNSILENYLSSVLNLDKENLTTRSRKIYSDVMESFDLEIDRTGNTLFGLYNGLTHFINHKAIGSNNKDFTFTENGALTIRKAEKFLMSLV
ncbi:DUF932 domain-containing protein [Flavobacterium sp.]|uniref:DUF932 domain-containing protein n=1 Tax=Flavobacterium sp. TaxID=239 RepID=UPI00374FE12C